MKQNVFLLLILILVGSAAGNDIVKDVAIQAGNYTILFDMAKNGLSDYDNELFPFYFSSPSFYRDFSTDYVECGVFMEYTYYKPLSVSGWYEKGGTKSLTVTLYVFNSPTDAVNGYDELENKFELSQPIQIDGHEGLIGLVSSHSSNEPEAIYRVDDLTVCRITSSSSYTISDLRDFLDTLVIREISIRSLILS